MKRWEYMTALLTEKSLNADQRELDALGDEGWELVAAIGSPEDFQTTAYYFKRPKTNKPKDTKA